MNIKNWNWHRIVRIVLAVITFYGAVVEGESILYLVAIFLVYQAVFNIKCIASLVPNKSCK